MISQLLLLIGCVLILHAAYSLQHYRSLLQDLIESSTGISIDVDEASTTIGDIATSSTVPQLIEPAVTICDNACVRTVSNLIQARSTEY